MKQARLNKCPSLSIQGVPVMPIASGKHHTDETQLGATLSYFIHLVSFLTMVLSQNVEQKKIPNGLRLITFFCTGKGTMTKGNNSIFIQGSLW
jgi:hypothetical protein